MKTKRQAEARPARASTDAYLESRGLLDVYQPKSADDSVQKPKRSVKNPLKSLKKLTKKPSRKTVKRTGMVLAVLVLLGAPIYMLLTGEERVGALVGNVTLYPDGDNAAGWDLCNNAACGGTAHYTLVDETSLNTADYVNMNTATAPNDGEVDDYTIQNPTVNGTFVATTQVAVKWYAVSMACNGNNPSCDAVTVNIFINGALQTGQQQSLGAGTTPSTAQLYTTTFNGNWGAINDLRITFTRNRVGGGNSNNADDDVRLYQAYSDVTYTYNKPQPKLALSDYIWENTDGSDSTLGEYTKYPTTALDTGSGGVAEWVDVTNILTSNDLRANTTLNSFNASHYIKTTGYNFDIPFNAIINGITITLEGRQTSGKFADFNAKLVKNDTLQTTTKTTGWPGGGGGEATAIVGGASDLWSDTWSAADINSSSFGVAVQGYVPDNSGFNTIQPDAVTIKISYSIPSITQLAASNTAVTARRGESLNLRTQLENTGGPLDAEKLGLFYDRGDGLWTKVESFAKAVTGNGTGCGASGSAAWTCTTVDNDTDNTGTYTSIAFSPSGVPYVSYYALSASSLMVAQYVGSGGTGCGASGSSAWTCTTVDNDTDDTGTTTSLAFSPSGVPYISYYDTTATSLMVAQYVGSGGTGCGASGSAAWTCTTVDNDTDNTGTSTSLAFSPSGVPYVSYRDSTAGSLMVAEVKRAGEITASTSYSGSTTLTKSHADMSSYSDSSNRNDSDCVATGGWNNGKMFLAEEGSGLTIADGQSTMQCTEVAWTIDTSQALANTTYRFVIATDDAIAKSKGKWRGMIAIDNYPTLTIEDDSLYTTHQTASKDTLYTLPDCTDTSWGCGFLDQDSDSTGQHSSMAFSPAGVPYVAYYDATAAALMVAQYVGSGGSGCGASGSTAWTCTKVDESTSDTGLYTSIAFSPAGVPYISYYDSTNTSLKVAYYDGDATASGCGGSGSAAWTCTTVDATDNVGQYTSIAFDMGGNPWISYYNFTFGYLEVARYVGSGGNCDSVGAGSDAWACTTVDGTGEPSGKYASIAFDQTGRPWIAYSESPTNMGPYLKVAKYVGSGGNCDAIGPGSDAWECTGVDASSASTGYYVSLAFDSEGNPWISYQDAANQNLMVANFVGSGGNCDVVSGSDAWQCTAVDNDADNTGEYSSIAFSPNGVPYISYYDSTATSLMIARYAGSGGTGCGTFGSTAWTCTTVDNGSSTGQYTSLAFGPAGEPHVSYFDATDSALKIAAYKGNVGAPSYTTTNTLSSRNAVRSSGRYTLNSGRAAAASTAACTGAADLLGLCGITTEDGQYDSITAAAYHRPMYQMRARFQDNTVTPLLIWAGQSSIAASTKTISLQVYRYGTTNAWETVSTNTACAASTACVISSNPSGTASEYFEADGSNYWIYFRVVQAESTSGVTTFKTDSLKAIQQAQQLRHGRTFNRGLAQPFITEQR